MSSIEVSYKELADRFMSAGNKVEPIWEYLKGLNNLNLISSEEIRKKLNKYFIPFLKKKLKETFYDLFVKKNEAWLQKKFVISSTSPVRKQKKKNFHDCSNKTKRRRIYSVLEGTPTNEVQKILPHMNTSDNANLSNKADESKYLPFTEHEALALLIDAKLSKAQYNLITQRLKEKKINVLPSYAQIIKAKKECYPRHIKVTESGASVKF